MMRVGGGGKMGFSKSNCLAKPFLDVHLGWLWRSYSYAFSNSIQREFSNKYLYYVDPAIIYRHLVFLYL
ncbi:Uncharacterised protein [Chlamydia trachomatis]|nr:Uncharacterised protein [Chlamydia trachomatis]